MEKTQQEFLHDVIAELGAITGHPLSQPAFAKRLGVPWRTFSKWLLSSDSKDYREMTEGSWSSVREVLEHERLKLKFSEVVRELAAKIQQIENLQAELERVKKK